MLPQHRNTISQTITALANVEVPWAFELKFNISFRQYAWWKVGWTGGGCDVWTCDEPGLEEQDKDYRPNEVVLTKLDLSGFLLRS